MPNEPDGETALPIQEPEVVVKKESVLFHYTGEEGNRLEDHYIVLGQRIGVGRGVRECHHKRTRHKRALKTLSKASVSAENFQREISALRTVDHPNLLRLYESFEDDHCYYIITELSEEGNLYEYLVKNYQSLTEAHIALLMRQILICVNHCHALNIIHCDIKPENILLEKDDANFNFVLADFGFAQFHDPETRMNRMAGTLEFCAPEVFRRNYGPKADVWSCGILAFVLLTGQFPFTGGQSADPTENANKIYRQIHRRRDHFDLDVWNIRSEEGKLFVQHLLTIDETERPTAQEALRHPWFQIIETEAPSQAPLQTAPELEKLVAFSAHQKLKQATYAYLVAHRMFQSRKRVIDRIFHKVDANSDGLISQREIEDSFRDEAGQVLTAEELKDIFERVDIDKNGSINYWEFLAATSAADRIVCDENLRIAFEAFDKDKSGSICAEEVKRLFYNQQLLEGDGDNDIDDSIIHAIIQQVDENGDGVISFEEFAKMMRENNLSHRRPRESDGDGNASRRQRR